MATFEQDVFISYNRKDASFVEFLVRTLEGVGLRCFQDVTGLKIFDKLDASLKSAIGRSRWLVAVISPSYLQSYWCLFEALEAIQGQDFDQRFLPIVVRYRPEDQSLDETFVLQALRDLDGQMTEFETQLITLKAYDLAPKLDKLRFVRSHLPGVFRQIHERIFPELSLWDDAALRRTLGQIAGRLAPDAPFDPKALVLDFDRLDAMPVVIPRLRGLPQVLWKARVGCQAWKNSPLVVGNQVLVGSAGSRWNEADAEDGIVCLDAESGARRWFAPMPADANRLLVSKGLVVTGCDDGSVVAVSVRDGAPRWRASLGSGIVGGPVKLSANIGGSLADMREGHNAGQASRDPILLLTYSGALVLLDLATGAELQRIEALGPVVGSLLVGVEGYRQRVLVPRIDGQLVFFEYSSIDVELTMLGAVTLQYADRYADTGWSVADIGCEPVLADGIVLQGIVRQTSYDDPPLIALKLADGAQLWAASDAERAVGNFGNLRGAPVVIGREAIFAAAYTRHLCAVALDDGKLAWAVDLGQGMFEQWCGPVADGRSVYLGRHDGYLHKVDTQRRARDWSLYLGDAERAGVAVAGEQALPEFNAEYAWSAGASSPILATPVIDRGRLYVGTHEGWLYCVANLGDAAT